jgi:SAM-dependent methyltransferase
MTIARTCRFCAAPLNHIFLDLGSTALANRNLRPGEEPDEQSYPLVARVCDRCFLIQVDEVVPPEAIFSDYDYFSAVSGSWVSHAERYVNMAIKRFHLEPQSLVLEVASNDGYLLQHMVKAGIPVLGIEPAANVAEAARARGVPTRCLFFSRKTAETLLAEGVSADLTIANNVLAHVPAIGDFVAGFATILKPNGVATFEFPHVLNLIEQLQFDTIYHEHFSYLSLLAVEQIFAAAGLRVFDVEKLPTHGGSLRVYACREEASHTETAHVASVRQREQAARLDSLGGYAGFATKVETVKQDFRAFLAAAKGEGKRIAAYGAAAKGNTFLNACNTTSADIIEVYDQNPVKQGKLLPGTHIPIVPPNRVVVTRPDYLLILPWNLSNEVTRTMRQISEWGGRFVTAVPHVKIFAAD